MPTSFAMRSPGPGYRFLTRMKTKESANKSDYNPVGHSAGTKPFRCKTIVHKSRSRGRPETLWIPALEVPKVVDGVVTERSNVLDYRNTRLPGRNWQQAVAARGARRRDDTGGPVCGAHSLFHDNACYREVGGWSTPRR